jgi:hypothetical protein
VSGGGGFGGATLVVASVAVDSLLDISAADLSGGVAHALVINVLSWCVTRDGLLRIPERRHPSPLENVSRDICSMIKRVAIILSAATLSFGLALPPKAFRRRWTRCRRTRCQRLDEERHHVEGFDVQRRNVQGLDVEGRHEKGRYEEELMPSSANSPSHLGALAVLP